MEKNHRKKYIKKIEYFKIIADNIRRLRLSRGWTQGDFAERAKVARSTLAAAEQGREISFSKLIRIAEALGLELPDLFISEEDRREISYKHKLFVDKIAKYFKLEEEEKKEQGGEMIFWLSLMVGAYIVTRMAIYLIREDPGQPKASVVISKLLAVGTIVIAIISLIFIFLASSGVSLEDLITH